MSDRPCEVCTFQHQEYFCTEEEKAQEHGCPFTDHFVVVLARKQKKRRDADGCKDV
jgi:hypothetical protein